ncbi:MAG: hypothetical protein LOY58_04670 [Gammaproteobacteria bacterium]|nr:hypothetical protein [Gammaproteobacteria bacterium]
MDEHMRNDGPSPVASASSDVREPCRAPTSMYDRLLTTTERPDILTVLSNLQEASQQRHLPTFQQCVRGGGRGGCGQGARHRHGGRNRP